MAASAASEEHPFGKEATELGLRGVWVTYDKKKLTDLHAELEVDEERPSKRLRGHKLGKAYKNYRRT